MSHNKHSNRKIVKKMAKNRTFYLALLAGIVIPSVVAAAMSAFLVVGAAAQEPPVTVPPELLTQYGLGLMGAAISVAGSCLGAGIAIYGAASAGAAAIAERPETSIWVLILAGLGEGVAIYGLLIAILILGKLPTVA